MNIPLLFKTFFVSLSMLFSSCFSPNSKHECTPEEVEGLRIRIELRVQEMRERTDANFGGGFFDCLASGAIDLEAFMRMDDEEIQQLLERVQHGVLGQTTR